MPGIPIGQVLKKETGGTSVSDIIIANQNKQPTNNVLDTAKSALGGIAAGVGGIGLTAIDYAGRKAVNAFGTDQMKANLNAAPSLNEQFKESQGGNQNPTAYGGGQLVGEVASLAAPVGAIGRTAKVASEALGAGQKTAKLIQAGTEGAAFTAGQGLAENKSQSLQDYAINTGLNIAFPAGGMVLKSVGENVPARIINSLIKPLQKDFAYEKNPGKAVAELGIVANDFDGLISGIKQKKDEIGQKIGSYITNTPVATRIDLNETLKPIDVALQNAYKTPRTNQALIARLEAVKDDISQNAGEGTLENAQALKGLVGDLTKWTGNATDDAAVNKSLKQVYGTIRSKMDDSLKTVLSQEQFADYKKASEQYGNLLSAENAAIYRDKILERSDLISFGAKNAGLLTGLSTAIATGGVGIPTILAGLAGAAIDKAAATPAFKTRLASILTKLAPQEVKTFFETVPTAKTLFDDGQIEDFIKETVDNTKARGLNAGFVDPAGFKSGAVPKTAPKAPKAPKASNALLEEARKYKSSEEFVRAKTNALHGSDTEIKQFSSDFLGKNTESKGSKNAFFFTSSKEMADEYGRGAFLKKKVGELGDITPEQRPQLLAEAKGKAKVNEVALDYKNPKIIKKRGLLKDNQVSKDIQKAKEEGYDAIIYKDVIDPVLGDSEKFLRGDITAVFDPKNVYTKSQLTDLYNQAKGK